MYKSTVFFVFCIFCIFTQALATSFDLRGIINGNRMGSIPLGMTLGSGELDVEGVCTRSGMTCQNCTVAVTCVPLPVGWLKVFLQECDNNTTCNAHTGSCSNESVPECSVAAQEFEHICEQVGIFPDAYHCRKFHLCSPPEGLPDGRPAEHRTAMCPRNYGYNPQTAQCSIKLKNGQCSERPVPECKYVGQHGVLPSSSNHYYVCLMNNQVLFPQIFICPNGWHFYGGFCQPEAEKKDNTDQNTQQNNIKNNNVVITNEFDNTNERVITTSASNTINTETTTLKSSTYSIDSFFSTEKPPTYSADTFLADKFDLSNYETTDDIQSPQQDDFMNSFEDGSDFW